MEKIYFLIKSLSFLIIVIVVVVLFFPNIVIMLGYVKGFRSVGNMDVARKAVYNYFIYNNKLPDNLDEAGVNLKDPFHEREYIYLKLNDSSYVLIDKIRDKSETKYNNKYKMIGIYFDVKNHYNDMIWNDFFIKEKGFRPGLFNE